MCFSQPRDTKTVLCDTTDFSIDLIPRKYRGSIVDASTNTDTLNQKKKGSLYRRALCHDFYFYLEIMNIF